MFGYIRFQKKKNSLRLGRRSHKLAATNIKSQFAKRTIKLNQERIFSLGLTQGRVQRGSNPEESPKETLSYGKGTNKINTTKGFNDAISTFESKLYLILFIG